MTDKIERYGLPAERTFWSAANEAFTAKERSQYNRFKTDLYIASDRLKAALPIGSPNDCDEYHRDQLRKRANELHALICEIPSMEGRR